ITVRPGSRRTIDGSFVDSIRRSSRLGLPTTSCRSARSSSPSRARAASNIRHSSRVTSSRSWTAVSRAQRTPKCFTFTRPQRRHPSVSNITEQSAARGPARTHTITDGTYGSDDLTGLVWGYEFSPGLPARRILGDRLEVHIAGSAPESKLWLHFNLS